MVYNTTEKIEYSKYAKAILEIWNGEGDTPADLKNTVKLDRDSRRYIHVSVKHVIKDKKEEESNDVPQFFETVAKFKN